MLLRFLPEEASSLLREVDLLFGFGSCWWQMARGQNPNRTPIEHLNPPKVGSTMGGAPKTPKWYPMGFDPQPLHNFSEAASLPFGLMLQSSEGLVISVSEGV